MEREFNILCMTKTGKTKFLSELFSDWIDEKDRKKALSFDKKNVDNIIPLLKSENEDWLIIAYFPVDIKWVGRDNKFY